MWKRSSRMEAMLLGLGSLGPAHPGHHVLGECLPCSTAWASGSSLGSVQPHRALSKAGSWSNGVAPLDLPEPLEMSQLRPEGRTGAGWAEGNVGRARQGRVCAVRAGETPGLASLGFMSWGQPGLCPSAMLLTPGASAPPSPSPQVRRLSARSVLVRGRCLQGPLGLGQTLRGPWGICV